MIGKGIPKKIHYVWLGDSPLPSRFKRNIKSWKKYNPDYEIIPWGNASLDLTDPFILAAVNQKAWAKLSDLVRLIAVCEHGGVYLDTDVEVRRSFDGFLKLDCFFGYQSLRDIDDPICNAVFGATPGNWFLKKVLEAFPRTSTDNVNAASTGPELISNLLIDLGLPIRTDRRIRISGIDVFPISTFYPYHWEEEFDESCVTDATYTIHHWDMSWHYLSEGSIFRKIQSSMKNCPKLYKATRMVYRRVMRVMRMRVNQR